MKKISKIKICHKNVTVIKIMFPFGMQFNCYIFTTEECSYVLMVIFL